MIGYYAHHQGSGHRQRALAIARHLRTPVTGLSSLGAPEGWPGGWVRLTRDDDPPADPAAATTTASGRLHWVPERHAGLRSRMAQIAAWIDRADPALLVVDVSVEVSVLGRLLGVPVVVCAMLGDRDDAPHALGRDVATALLAPWPAPPGPPRGNGVVHVGAFSRFDDRTPDPAAVVTGTVLVLWGSGGSDVDEADFAAARDATPGWDWRYRIPGRPGTTGAADGSGLWHDLESADVVVVHGGQNAVAEVAAARRPAVVVAQRRPFAEQERRVDLLLDHGVVALPRWPAPQAWPGLLRRAHEVGGEVWKSWSSGDGARRAAEVLDGLAVRGGR